MSLSQSSRQRRTFALLLLLLGMAALVSFLARPAERDEIGGTAEDVAVEASSSSVSSIDATDPDNRRLDLPTPRTVEDVVGELRSTVRSAFIARCRKIGVAWPPKRMRLLALKSERRLEVWIADSSGPYRRLTTYRILAASGRSGPKRRQGDRQVPEGFYGLTELNPNSRFHLSIRVSYPNQEDIEHATVPRDEMGGDIFIHGDRVSIGCLAIGDRYIEELFTLAALVPVSGRSILIAPVDFRTRPNAATAPRDPWLRDLYGRLARFMRSLPK